MNSSVRTLAATLGALLFALLRTGDRAPQARQGCPETPVATLTAEAPLDVCIPDGFSDVAVSYFDDYSWRAFVAAVWPASARRGVPDTARPVSAPGPRVFETYKPLWEIFHRDGSSPDVSFATYDAAGANPCGVESSFGTVTIGSHSGIDDIGQAGIGTLEPPLVAQNGRYVRTLTLFNQTAFDHIVSHRFYLRSALPDVPVPRPDRPVIEFPEGSVAVKSAWIDIADLNPALARRMYTRRATIKDATGTGCGIRTIGLVGLHIAHKTASRPQWIWSSFEQKDLVPPAWADSPDAFVLNDRRGTPMPATNPLSLTSLVAEPARPFNVFRTDSAPILTDTELTTFAYQHLLEDSPWRFYRLVMTQWPRRDGNQASPVPATIDGSVANSFPGTGAFSAFTNLTMETFDQRAVQLGCMSCHNRVRLNADFMWTVFDHAYPSRLAAAASPLGSGLDAAH